VKNIKDFKEFLLRGNVVDLAVAVVIGAAFGAVVKSLVENIFTPLLAIPGSKDFSGLQFSINKSTFHYGVFLNDLISFITIAAVIFFFVVKPINKLLALRKVDVDVTESKTKTCPECLSSIPTAARKCAFCTSDVSVSA
jgi:large conductance mechanosensitive channel